MVNACRLRAESDVNTEEPVYNRNPYTNVDILVGRLIGKETVSYDSTFECKEHGCDWSVRLSKDGLIITNSKDGDEFFRKGMFVVYDWEENIGRELNDNALLLQPGEVILLPCQLEPTQVISIKVTLERELLLLPKFAIWHFNL